MGGQLSEGAAVGVVGEHPAAVAAVRAAGGEPTVGHATAVVESGPAAVVAVGESALVDLVRAGIDAPVLPVAAGVSVRSVPGIAVEPAVERFLAGDWTGLELPLLSATPSPADVPVLFDLTLVTDEPARISEYTVRNGTDPVATFRADGVVVATPAGSPGYARAADGSVLAHGTGVVSVVPIAPFATDTDSWVLPDDAVRLAVERDETPVELLADGRSTGVVDPGEEIRVEPGGALTVAVVEESQPFFGE